MDKSNRKAIESKIVLAVQEILKSSHGPASEKLDKLIKSSAKQIAKKLARLLEEKETKKATAKKSVITKTAARKKTVAAKKTVKVVKDKK
jgi:hypothetical protein